ncbi:hypothetical protein ABTY61_40275 [Kitasatospora sp. NPDC096128]|uniref:hypothetical protein n=1 Tax=Kitasatospora sp. NPDC096128 TaxID=3155547 RepID=UPI0033319317
MSGARDQRERTQRAPPASTAAKRARAAQKQARLPRKFTDLLRAEDNALRRLAIALRAAGLHAHVPRVVAAIPPSDDLCHHHYLRAVQSEAFALLERDQLTLLERYRLERDLADVDRRIGAVCWGPDYWYRPMTDAVLAALHHAAASPVPEHRLLSAVRDVTEHWESDLENLADTVRQTPRPAAPAPGTAPTHPTGILARHAHTALLSAYEVATGSKEDWELCQQHLRVATAHIRWAAREALAPVMEPPF